MLEAPGKYSLAEFGNLLAVANHDGVLADKIDPADMAVEIDTDACPVEARRNLLDVGGFAGAVIALDEDSAVVGEPRQDCQGGVAVKPIRLIQCRDVFLGLAEGGYFEVAVDAENLTDGDGDIGFVQRKLIGLVEAALLAVMQFIPEPNWLRCVGAYEETKLAMTVS